MLWSEQAEPLLRLELRITDSQVRIDVVAGDDVESDLATLRNDVVELAQALLDASLFTSAGYLAIELERVVLANGSVVELLPVFLGLRDLAPDHPMTDAERGATDLLLRNVGRSAELRVALADVQRALTAGRDTTFHAFRAVESLRQRFVLPEDGRDTASSWSRMWVSIGGTRELVTAFQTQATRRRHGVVDAYSHDERRVALERAREAVILFARWIDSDREAARLSTLPSERTDSFIDDHQCNDS